MTPEEAFKQSSESITGPITKGISKGGILKLYEGLDKAGQDEFKARDQPAPEFRGGNRAFRIVSDPVPLESAMCRLALRSQQCRVFTLQPWTFMFFLVFGRIESKSTLSLSLSSKRPVPWVAMLAGRPLLLFFCMHMCVCSMMLNPGVSHLCVSSRSRALGDQPLK